jgi:hypothetical protein
MRCSSKPKKWNVWVRLSNLLLFLSLIQVSRMAEDEYNSLSDEDEAVASDLDMHSLILGRSHDPEPEPPTADEVIKEIDFIMQVNKYLCK